MEQRLEVIITTDQEDNIEGVRLKGGEAMFSGADLAWVAASVIVAAAGISDTDASVYTDSIIPKLVEKLMMGE